MFGKKKEPENKVEQQEEQQPPRLVFEIKPDGNVLVGCSWPKPANGEDASEICQAYSSLIFLLTTGRLTPAIQHAISDFKTPDKIGDEMAKAILLHLHHLLVNSGQINLSTHPNKPIVSPREAFQVRGGG